MKIKTTYLKDSMHLTGLADVADNLNHLMAKLPDLTAEGFEEIVTDIGANAKLRAPVKTGDLRGSMRTEVYEDGDEVVGEVTFNTPYAAVQHERVDFSHPQGGEAKYLERAALEKRDQIADIVAKHLSDLFGGG